MTRRVLVVGDAMLDVVVRPVGRWAPTSDTPALVRVGRGGSAANFAVAVRRAAPSDLEVMFLGVAGNDAAAQIVRGDLESVGVVARLSGVEGDTGVVVALVDRTGQRAMMTQRGVNAQLTFADVAPMIDSSLAHVHVSGYTVLEERTRHLVPRIIAAASAEGATTSVDVCSVGPLRQVGAENFTTAAGAADVLFANEEEALELSSTRDVDAALEELGHQWSEVVVTLGARGVRARHDATTYTALANVEDVVDTTGAGDSASGTYLAYRLGGADVQTSLQRAMTAAARVVRALGSRG